MAKSEGLTLQSATAAAGVPVSDLLEEVKAEFPTATVAEEELATVVTDTLVSLDGRTVWLLRLDDMPDTNAGGPAGSSPSTLRTLCAVMVFDSTNGEFLVTIRHLSAN